MSIESIKKFLNLAKQDTSAAFSWLESINISMDDLLVAAIEAGYSSYKLSDLLDIDGMQVGPKTLIAAIKKGYSSYGLSGLCKKTVITDVNAGETVLIAAIEAGYRSYGLSDLLEIEGVTVTTKVLLQSLKTNELQMIYQLYKKANYEVDRSIEQEFNDRVVQLFSQERGNLFSNLSEELEVSILTIEKFFGGMIPYSKNQLEKVCFNNELLSKARSVGIFGKELLSDCLSMQMQNTQKDGKLDGWLNGPEFQEYLDLLLFLNKKSALNDTLELLIREKCSAHHLEFLIKNGAQASNDLKFAIEAASQPLLEEIISNQPRKNIYDKFQQLEKTVVKRLEQSPEAYAGIESIQSDFIEQYEAEQQARREALEERRSRDEEQLASNDNEENTFCHDSKVDQILDFIITHPALIAGAVGALVCVAVIVTIASMGIGGVGIIAGAGAIAAGVGANIGLSAAASAIAATAITGITAGLVSSGLTFFGLKVADSQKPKDNLEEWFDLNTGY